ncbi:MAG: glycoside hydrolase family 125 protein [Bacteroidales bacterium]|jgi:meiotically up-regulated gene 157 (Mug157) protein|nr:glycoside hydrolase family 125 protein [Bacteroidales bacterium]MBQ5602935.1 glycoside hydrolase family 125 protein [Bacteroidales bacterium]
MKKIIALTIGLAMALNLAAQNYRSERPSEGNRLFTSEVVELKIQDIKAMLVNPKIAWMFENCYPNTLDTTVHFDEGGNAGRGDTFIYTGDIPAMWLRDSGAQVWPYVRYAAVDPNMRKMIAGTIIRQFKLICMDPYANAFNDGPTGEGHTDDKTGERPNKNVFERKWEIDSHCYPIRLAYAYWKTTGDTSVFDEEWLDAIELTLKVFKDQQRKKGHGDYFFLRETDRQFDTKCCVGKGNPVKPCGLIASSFRPSDDATTFEFLVPANFFAVKSLRQAAEILETVNHQGRLARECTSLADEVEKALKKHAVVKHPKYGKIYAYEVDGFGNALMMDDANIPSLLSLPYLEAVDIKDPVYKKTRKFILSEYNPYFHKGKVAEGVGSPHIDHDMIWPMSIMMRAFTAQSDKEIKKCVEMLMNTDANTGFMHESFHKDNADDFTREWFAWQNSLFGELIVHLIDNGKLEVLNSIKAPKYKDPYKRR